jgi:nucleotide-binding universal stress UspA family protein
MYQRISLPLDGSERAEIAIPHVVALARLGDAEVLIVRAVDSVIQILGPRGNAIDPISGDGSPTVEIAEEAVTAQTQQALEYLRSVRDRMAADGVKKIRVEVLEGWPQEVLAQVLSAERCDIVIMATHGTGLRRTVLGSVADHLVRHSPGCSVLLVDAHDHA